MSMFGCNYRNHCTAAALIISAILVGVLVFGFALTLTSAACFARCLFDCAG